MKRTSVMAGLLAMFVIAGVVFAGVSGPAPIPSPPVFYIATNSTILCKGQINTIPITITNAGTRNYSVGVSSLAGPAMYEIQLGVSSSSKGFYVPNHGVVYVNGTIQPENSITEYLPIFVSTNASLLSSLGVSINYYYDTFYSDSEIRNLTFEVQSCPSQLVVGITPKIVLEGIIQNITINFTNSGTTPLNAISAYFSIPSHDGEVFGSSQILINSLEGKDTFSTNRSIFISGNASESFPLNLTATFYNGTQIEQVENSTTLIPSGIINISTSGLTLSPGIATQGGIFSISFVLTNTGTAAASALTATAILPNSSKNFTAFGSNPVFVGNLGVNSQSPVTLSLTTGTATKAGKYDIPVVISYLNTLRQKVNITMGIPVTVVSSNFSAEAGNSTRPGTYGSSKTGSGSSVILTGILVVVIIVLGYLLYKEKKKGHAK